MTSTSAHATHESFRHEAFMYGGLGDFVPAMTAFLRDGVAAGEPSLVVVDAAKIGCLREALGADADRVVFADMAEVGANPGRIIPAWREFVDAHPGRPLRGIGEPIHPGRSDAELAECHRHEALLNLAFAGTPAFRLVCPYDTAALPAEVVDTAHRTHPLVSDGDAPHDSAAYDGLDAIARPLTESLPEPPPGAAHVQVELDALGALRRLVATYAAGMLTRHRIEDLQLAVSEVATNAIRHGGGRGTMSVWRAPDALICEVRDPGRFDAPLAGRVRPHPGQIGGYGLWLANQVCDLVQVRSLDGGSVVRLHMRLAQPATGAEQTPS